MSFTMRRRDWRWRLVRLIPRRKHLKGTWIHRRLGERVLDQRLWRPEVKAVAGGVAIGVFMGLTPAYGLYLILSIVTAYLLRQNIPASFLGCWVFNPITAPLLIALEAWLGGWLAELVHPDVTENTVSLAANAMRTAWEFALGSVVLGLFGAVLSYGLVLVGYRWASRIALPRREAAPAPAPREPV